MSDAIVIENVSKRYRLGVSPSTDTLREAITRIVRARLPGRRRAPEMPNAAQRGRQEIWALHDVSLSVPRGEVAGGMARYWLNRARRRQNRLIEYKGQASA